MNQKLLVFSVFIVASCGLAYELIMSALSSYLLGDSILQFSTIIGAYLFAMGVGAGLSKFIKDEDLLTRFIDIEIFIGILGGVSAILLMAIFFYSPPSFRVSVYLLVFFIGLLVGMEIPIVMRLLHQNGQEIKSMISNVLSFDYLGALFVSLLFPLVFMPNLGINRTAIVFGLANLGIAWLSLSYFNLPQSVKNKKKLFVILSSFLMGLLFVYSETMIGQIEKGIYGNQIIFSKHTLYQKLLVTKNKSDIRLYINGNLQFSTRDERRYHEALVHPPMMSHKAPKSVLVLGGGDGLAVREILKYKSVERVVLVDLDPDMTGLFKANEMLKEINEGSLNDKRVSVINKDASKWLEESSSFFDVIIIDFPDPSNYALGKLYSDSFYELVKARLSHSGFMSVQSTSPYFAPNVYWTVNATLESVGFNVSPYHAYVPSFGDWGFFLVSNRQLKIPEISLDMKLTYLTNDTMKSMFVFPSDMPKLKHKPNTLNNQNVVEFFVKDWGELQ